MIYDFKCKCGNTEAVSMSPSRYTNQIKCKSCGTTMQRVFTPLNFKISNRPYDYGKGMDAEKEQRIALERTGGWDG